MPSTALRSARLARLTALALPKCASRRVCAWRRRPGTSSSGVAPTALARLGAVGADGEAVRLVAQALDEIQHRVVAFQRKGTLAGAVELLFAVIAVDALGNADHGMSSTPCSRMISATALTCPAPPSISNRSGHSPLSRSGSSFLQAGEAAGQNLFHHAEIVARCQVVAPDVELAILRSS